YKKVLIVDDISDSGNTLIEISNILNQSYKNVKFQTLTLFSKPTTKYKPTYFAKQTDEWIEFFWSKDLS
ncbi:MAG: phosphoribosyltransferase, partial [Campylobacterales bacterium]|nr:phosphoribosyltransferase [Campylobacterales bacterium]